jgi:hypothetical protein
LSILPENISAGLFAEQSVFFAGLFEVNYLVERSPMEMRLELSTKVVGLDF